MVKEKTLYIRENIFHIHMTIFQYKTLDLFSLIVIKHVTRYRVLHVNIVCLTLKKWSDSDEVLRKNNIFIFNE